METPFLDQLVSNYCHCGECDECALHAGAKAELAALKESAQQNAHLTGGGLCAECGSPSWAHGAIGHDFVPPHPQVV